MLTLTLGHPPFRKRFRAPEAWEECTHAQRRDLAALAWLPEPMRTRDVWEQVVQTTLGCSDRYWRKLVLSLDEWGILMARFAWVFENRMTTRPFPAFTFEGVAYHLPKEGMADTKAIDLAMANVFFLEFANPDEPDPTALDKLLFTLCRPLRTKKELSRWKTSEHYDGDDREPFNEARTLARAARAEGCDFKVKVAVLKYFEAQNEAFLNEYEPFFGKGSRQPRYGDGRGWVLMLKNIAREGAFGPFEAVCRQPVHLLWASLLDDHLNQKELEAEQENA